MAGALSGIRVLDFTQGDGGAYATMQLGDGGAEVIKVEPLDGDWARGLGPPFVNGESALFLGLNRNKKSVALSLKSEQGKEIAIKLAQSCDVLVENMRPGVAERLGLGYEALKAINPKLIYCSVTALESEGPEKDLPATELTVQARARVINSMGEPGKPPVRVGTDFVATAAGIYAFQGIVAALFYRRRTGKGQKVETSMLRAIVYHHTSTVTFDCSPDGGYDDPRGRVREPGTGYRTADLPVLFTFPYMLVGYPADERFHQFCQMVGLDHIVNDPRFAKTYDRFAHAKELKEYFDQALSKKSSQEVLDIVESLGCLNAPLHNYETLFSHPQALENEMLAEFNHPTAGKTKTVGLPWKLSDTPGQIRLPPPLLGQHTEEVLTALGCSKGAIQRLQEEGVIHRLLPATS